MRVRVPPYHSGRISRLLSAVACSSTGRAASLGGCWGRSPTRSEPAGGRKVRVSITPSSATCSHGPAWSGRLPVTEESAGSNPAGSAAMEEWASGQANGLLNRRPERVVQVRILSLPPSTQVGDGAAHRGERTFVVASICSHGPTVGYGVANAVVRVRLSLAALRLCL